MAQKKRAEEEGLESDIMKNVNDLIMPHLQDLKKEVRGYRQKMCLDSVESNLRIIISPFARRLTKCQHYLTPSETKVADFIRQGRRTKEIAFFLNLSTKTVESHRENIRGKLGLKHKKISLRTCLLTMC